MSNKKHVTFEEIIGDGNGWGQEMNSKQKAHPPREVLSLGVLFSILTILKRMEINLVELNKATQKLVEHKKKK